MKRFAETYPCDDSVMSKSSPVSESKVAGSSSQVTTSSPMSSAEQTSRAVGRLLEVWWLWIKSIHLAMKWLKNLSVLCVDNPWKHDHTCTNMESNVVLCEHTPKNTGPAEVKLHLSGLTDTCTQMHRIRLRGSGGMLPRENLWIFDTLRWFLSFFFGLKTFTWKFWHGKITQFASRPHTWRFVSIGIGSFRYTCGTWQRSGAQKPVNIRTTPIKNVWPPRSQSVCSQVSTVLFHAWTAKFMWAQICVGNMCTSEELATLSQSKHCSSDWWVCQTCSSGPVREKWMHKRNSTIKSIQGSKFNFQSLWKKRGSIGCPSHPASNGLEVFKPRHNLN